MMNLKINDDLMIYLIQIKQTVLSIFHWGEFWAYAVLLPSDGLDRDSGGELGHQARAGKDILSLCLSRLKPRVPIHLHSPIHPVWQY